MRVLTVGYNFLPYGCDRDFLLPPDARDWLPAGHLSWAVIDAVGELDLGARSWRTTAATGKAALPTTRR